MSIIETFSNSIDLTVIDEYDKDHVMQIWTVLGHVCHVACRRVLWNRLFRHLSNYVFRVRNFGNTKAVRVIFFFQMYKIEFRFQKFSEKLRKIFFFWDNCIWIGIVKLSLLRTGYFSSAANVLTNSPKIWHINKRDFLEHNFFASDHWIW